MVDETKKDILEADLLWMGERNPNVLEPLLPAHATLPDAHHPETHTHPTHGDINFTGTISADGEAGLTGSRTIDGHTLTFKNGILVGYS